MATRHGTIAGYRNGCRSRGGCEFDKRSRFLSCTEAVTARRRDFGLGALPADQLILRGADPVEIRIALDRACAEKHGTPWGYRRGCRSSPDCPHQVLGRITCSEAKKQYYRRYGERRLCGAGTPIEHGTRGGYDLGCRARRSCPGEATGRSCAQARSEQRSVQVRARGVRPRRVEGDDVVALIMEWESAGFSLRAIAAMTSVGRATVSELVRRGREPRDGAVLISPATRDAILRFGASAPAPSP